MAIVFNPFTGNFDFTGSGGASGITVGTTTITSGTNGRILYDNSGVVGEATVTGTLGSVVLSTAPTLTGPVTLNEAVGSSGLTITGATQTTSQPALNITQTWNAGAVAFTLVKGRTTLTAAATASYLIDLQSGTSPYGGGGGHFRATQTGGIELGNANYGSAAITIVSGSCFDFNGGGVISNGNLQFNKLILSYSNGDVILERDAAAVLALKNSTTAQTFRVYGTTTGSKYVTITHNGTDGTINTSAGKLNLSAFAGSTTYVGNDSAGSSTAVSIGGSTQTATSGTYIIGQTVGTFNPSATSTMVAIGHYINPTINYSAGTPGAGSYEALKIAVTETALPTGTNYLIRASAGASGTTDKFWVKNDGTIYTASRINFGTGNGAVGITSSSSTHLIFNANGSNAKMALVSGTDLQISNSGTLQWANSSTVVGTADLILARDAAAVLALRNSTNAQTFRVYNTYTSSTNYEMAGLFWSSNVFHIGADKGSGGGTARVLQIDYGGTSTAAISVPITSGDVTIGGAIKVTSATMIKTATSFTDGAAAATGTLTNAPAAGNPTKWIPIDDNGTTRYIPAW